MLTSNSVHQLLQVLRLFRERSAKGFSVESACQDAIHEVARAHTLRYQTIEDLCRRRLKLTDIAKFHRLLTEWTKGNPKGLIDQLIASCSEAAHDEIRAFFLNLKGPATATPSESPSPSAGKTTFDTFSFQLAHRDARMLRALSEMEGISPPELIGQIVCSAVQEKMKQLAQDIINK